MWLRRGDQGRPAQAATVPLRKEWHLSHFNSWSCFRQGWGLLEKLPLHANLIFLFFFPCSRSVQAVVTLEANWAKGCAAGLGWSVGVGTGSEEQAHSDTHHAAGTQGSLLEALFCATFFSISCRFISLDGWTQGLLWGTPPVVVVWPKLSDCLPAIADLVLLSTAPTTIALLTVVYSMVSGGWQRSRSGTKQLMLL